MLLKNVATQDQNHSFPLPRLALLIHQYFLQKDRSYLSLTRQQITDDEIKKIAEWLQMQPQITSLLLFLNNISAKGAMDLVACTSLTRLDLGINPIGDEGAKILANSASLTDLDLRSANIGSKGAGYLALNTVLNTLSLHNNNIGDEGAKQFSTLNSTLSTLRLQNNKISAGARHFVAHPTLTLLCLAENSIDAEDFTHLTNNKTLIDFDVSGNVAEQCKLNKLNQNKGKDKIAKFLILIAIERNNPKTTMRFATIPLDLIEVIFSSFKIADVGLNSFQMHTLFDSIMSPRLTRSDLKKNNLAFFKTKNSTGADEYKVERTHSGKVPNSQLEKRDQCVFGIS